MRSVIISSWLLALLAAFAASGRPRDPARPGANTTSLNGHAFTLPPGFTITLAAKAPLVDRPIVADFDEQGRLYVADSSGSNEPVAKQLKNPTHRIVRLEDTDGDGAFDKSVVFADKMMFPEGAMWRDGSLYVAAPPSIWKLTDTDGDGVADKREEWFKGLTLTGCANDLHGPYNGPDGWVYWAKGAFAKQEHSRPGKSPFVTRAAHIFRARPDGTGVEPVMTGGMDNPVDVVFTPGGERVFTTTFFQHPGGGLRDGLVHAVYGGVYGKDHGPVYEHPWTGPALMPVLTHMGPAAPAGLASYESRVFGPEYEDNLFAAQFNLRKVSRHALAPSGATFTSKDSDFVVSANHDFHPTDVLEDADGSLLVIDTGGWYKLCCPSSQLVKADVLGAIYRVRKNGAAKVADPRGRKLAWDKAAAADLVSRLDDARPAVRWRAVAALAARGAVGDLEKAIASGASAARRRNAVWAATRIDGRAARAAVRKALADRDGSVRQAALHSVALHRDADGRPALLEALRDKSPAHRRAAAEALGRLGDSRAVAALLKAVAEPADRVLEHSLIYAMIEIAHVEETRKGLEDDTARVRRAAMIALDQMPRGDVKAAEVIKELSSTDAALREAAWWVAGRRPAWGADLAGHFRAALAGAAALKAGERDELAGRLARFTAAEAIRDLLAERLSAEKAGKDEKVIALRAAAASRHRAVSKPWAAALQGALAGSDKELIAEALAAARQLNLNEAAAAGLLKQLRALAGDEKKPAELRVAAAASLPGSPALDAPLFALLCRCAGKDRPLAERGPAAGVLARAALTESQLLDLADVLKAAGPMELEALLEPFAKAKGEKVGLRALAAVRAAPARAGLHVDRLRARFAKYPESVRKEAASLAAALDADLAERQKQIEALVGEAKKGDVRRGQAVFNSAKAACASCHAIGYVGGKIGPDLTRIGNIRDERDLLESILFPSASLVRSYESVQVTTKQGVVHNGLVKQETPDAVVLTKSATEEVRLRRADIEELTPSKVSIMPAGMDKVLTRQELADLVAFLRASR